MPHFCGLRPNTVVKTEAAGTRPVRTSEHPGRQDQGTPRKPTGVEDVRPSSIRSLPLSSGLRPLSPTPELGVGGGETHGVTSGRSARWKCSDLPQPFVHVGLLQTRRGGCSVFSSSFGVLARGAAADAHEETFLAFSRNLGVLLGRVAGVREKAL